MPKTRWAVVSVRDRHNQPNAICGSNLDPDLNKSTIKNILEIRGKIKHGKPGAVKELILFYVIIQTLLNIKKNPYLLEKHTKAKYK